ncbi:RadC family protein [Candidatus Laterigemmans baculatus]|uniref:RadC family protein n=1 Tax=Candidatus Laterigemmans baculatus TaxID=2770505 RepID=UPI0013D8E97B|nr:DNA repair protein RadC [Candidatus Laterigemmans baculatus]
MSEVKPDPRERYRQMLAPMQAREEFTIAGIQAVCEDVSPRAVTSLVRQLTLDGWLVPVPTAEPKSPARVGHRWSRRVEAGALDGWIERQVCGTQLRHTPAEERPRERLLRLGAAQLRMAELLAILIRTGRKGESALQAGERIANRFAPALDRLTSAGPAEMKEVSPAVSAPAYCQIMAGIELGRRVAQAIDRSLQRNVRISGAEDAIKYCRRQFGRMATDARQEEFHIVTLDTKHQPIATHQITVGTLDASLVHPREVFRPAIRDAASAILLVHNHPSGDPTPSPEDRQVTRQLERAAETVGISVLDHIIVAGDRALSLKQWDAA